VLEAAAKQLAAEGRAGREQLLEDFAVLTLRALSYFNDVPSLAAEVRERLEAAVRAVDRADLPVLTLHVRRDNRRAP
jgi:hypothetical protein